MNERLLRLQNDPVFGDQGEDQSEYIGHGQAKKGTGISVAECVLQHLKKYEADTITQSYAY